MFSRPELVRAIGQMVEENELVYRHRVTGKTFFFSRASVLGTQDFMVKNLGALHYFFLEHSLESHSIQDFNSGREFLF